MRGLSFLRGVLHPFVGVVAVAAGKDLTDVYLLSVGGLVAALSLHVGSCPESLVAYAEAIFGIVCVAFFLRIVDVGQLGADMDEAVPGVVDAVLGLLGCRYPFGQGAGADGAGYVVAAIDVIDDDVVRGILAVDEHGGVAAHVGHASTAEHFALGILKGCLVVGTGEPRADVAGLDGHSCVAAHVALVAAAIDVAAYLYLSLARQGQKPQQPNKAHKSH